MKHRYVLLFTLSLLWTGITKADAQRYLEIDPVTSTEPRFYLFDRCDLGSTEVAFFSGVYDKTDPTISHALLNSSLQEAYGNFVAANYKADGHPLNEMRCEVLDVGASEFEGFMASSRQFGWELQRIPWKYVPRDPLAVHTASGQAPSKASAVNAARDLATSGYGNTIRKWGDSNCTQGTKLASQYGTARVTQWTCNIEFQTAATDPDGVARNAGGKGDTEDGAIANAKSLATAGLLPSQIKSWDDPICSTQQEHASRYNSTQMKTVWVCAVGYTTYQ